MNASRTFSALPTHWHWRRRHSRNALRCLQIGASRATAQQPENEKRNNRSDEGDQRRGQPFVFASGVAEPVSVLRSRERAVSWQRR